MTSLYFDANATHGPLFDVIQGVVAVCEQSWNPSAVHANGQSSRALIENARDKLKCALGTKKSRIIFTSGATEANNLALQGILAARNPMQEGRELVISAVEHPSIDLFADYLATKGVAVSKVFPRADKCFVAEDFADACSEKTVLVSVIGAHNETGNILPLREIVEAVRKKAPQAVIHSDLVQWFGKLPLSFDDLDIDAATVSGHKVGALPGVGALVMKNHLSLEASIRGGSQELRYRAGTENVPGIWSFGVAADKVTQRNFVEHNKVLKKLRDRFVSLVKEHVSLARFAFEQQEVLPNTVNLQIPGCAADDLVVALDLAGLRVSTGAACSSGKQESSVALQRWGLSKQEASESIRFSFLPTCTQDEIDSAVERFMKCVHRTLQCAA